MTGESVVLVIDTATETVVTGVVRLSATGEATTLAERTVHDHRRHAEILTTLIGEVLAEASLVGADLDAVVAGTGPGPFTGLRVGLATAAAYGDALGLPVHGVCSLDAIASVAGEQSALVVTDARRREVYWARYAGGERVAGPDVAAPAVVAETLDDAPVDTVVGPPRFTEQIAAGRAEEVGVVHPSARALAAAASPELGTTPGPLEPLYLRRPDAVELKDQRRKSLLPVNP
ncbi:tRNA (adenosine(37)-N6)-threonylcarbamoyltransferase complex dimerization subunit type 1 TsaB [Gordonia humi]|uniref:tRNA threonylcarbamoyl adenosine modification protein YeaZ n=1 Tax=Gordonia humi TaxID=686429 RepID=A0A840F5P7_9ACTN|nr:tRNA (adenosine(37)-N6)-threonylcarbamoyltransferase complex dimerization subunit type 1 TsaB [Gordonia humi]MBB4135570.1 tRNA threonylcarbamoyl adenosine modification protein YeaZ [Gordonia humi]